MNPLNAFSYSNLLIIAIDLPLFLLLITKGTSKVAKIYSLHILCVLGWGILAFFISITNDQEIATLLLKTAYTFVLFIPVFFYHAVSHIVKEKQSYLNVFSYLQAIYFIFQICRNNLIAEVKWIFNSFYFLVATECYLYSFIIWCFIVCIGHTKIIMYYNKSFPDQKKQILGLILAIIGFMAGITNFLPGFNLNIYPIGNFFVPIHGIIITYFILRHQLLDIKIVVRTGVIYSILVFIIAILYLLTVFTFEKIVQSFLGYHSMAISVFAAFSLGILFFPLRSKIQNFVDLKIFTKTHEKIFEENLLLKEKMKEIAKMKAIATFANGMAHEIKNPLTAVKTFTEYLPQKMDDKEFLNTFSRLVSSEVNRIDSIVNRLLDFAKPSPLEFSKEDPQKIIEDTLELLSAKFIDKHIHVVKQFSDLPKIKIDKNQFKQAILNIILNAIDAMEKGGKLTVTTELIEVNSLEHAEEFDYVRISIQDSGCGIDKKDLKQIFDPFFTKKDTGTGLGLSITHGIIAEHGGVIQVESEKDKGTTFTIKIPIKPD